jgi:drug/metabolite transporter (DMT)-like permease
MAGHLWAITETAAHKAARDGSPATGYAAGLLAWLLAGTVFVAVKGVAGEMPAWTLCCVRSLISGLVLLPFAWPHRADMAALLKARWKELALIGAIGLGLTQGLMFTALGFTSAVNTGIVFALAPMITLMLAHLLLSEPLGPGQALGTVVAFLGIVTISVEGSLTRLLGFEFGVGDLIALGAALMFAGYTVLLKRAHFGLPPIPLLVILLAAGSLASLPFAVFEYLDGGHDNLTTRGYLALLYIGTIGGALMYLLYNASIEILGPARAGTLIYTQMLFVAFFAWLILGETLAWYHFLGGGLVVTGVLLVTLLRPKPATVRQA